MLSDKRYGVKVTIISDMDFDDWKEILEAIKAKGYKIDLVENGNAVCIKEDLK